MKTLKEIEAHGGETSVYSDYWKNDVTKSLVALGLPEMEPAPDECIAD